MSPPQRSVQALGGISPRCIARARCRSAPMRLANSATNRAPLMASMTGATVLCRLLALPIFGERHDVRWLLRGAAHCVATFDAAAAGRVERGSIVAIYVVRRTAHLRMISGLRTADDKSRWRLNTLRRTLPSPQGEARLADLRPGRPHEPPPIGKYVNWPISEQVA